MKIFSGKFIISKASIWTSLSLFIILLNGFQKKSQKTPKNEIELAEKLKKQYFDEKREK